MKKHRATSKPAAKGARVAHSSTGRLVKTAGPAIVPLEKLLVWIDDIAMWLDWSLSAAEKWNSRELTDATLACLGTFERFRNALSGGSVMEALKISYKLAPELDALSVRFNAAPKNWLRHWKQKPSVVDRVGAFEELVTHVCRLGDERALVAERASKHFEKNGRLAR